MTRKKGRPVGQTIGSIIVGFDQQIFRTTPPAEELVAKGQPVRGVSGEDGSAFDVVFPGDAPAPEGRSSAAPETSASTAPEEEAPAAPEGAAPAPEVDPN